MEATDELEEIEEFNEENIDTPPTQKEKIIDDLEPRPAAASPASTSITLELGDIIEIHAPTNPDIHLVTAIIQYIDEQKIKLINVATARFYLLNIADNGRFTDETITQIALLDRSDEKGYARQNQLNVRTWVDIHFGGEIPAIITGEITNLEEDMIEITTYPDLRTIFIDFAYRGIPEYLPIENNEFFTEGLTLMDWLRQYVPAHVTDADEPFIRGFLGKMLFSGDDILKKTNVLSGGEKVRCMISKMMLQNPNLVILDEPTNHLDLESITAFNDGMISFPGVVLFTTHDHQFISTVANRIIEITPKGMIDRLMTYDEYLADERVKALKEEYYS